MLRICSCTGNRRGGRGESNNEEPRNIELSGPGSSGGICLLPGRPLILPQLLSTTSGTVGGAIPQAPGRPVRQSQGRPAMHWLEPVGGGSSVKVHCRRRWQATFEPIGDGGAAKEGESGSARTRAVGEGLGDLLEGRRGYGDVTWREAGGNISSHGE